MSTNLQQKQQYGTNKPKRTRSRTGCHSCKKSKIKCDEKKPKCSNCIKLNKECDYTLKLTWGGRPYKKPRIEKLNSVANFSISQSIKKEDSPLGSGSGSGSGVRFITHNPSNSSSTLLPITTKKIKKEFDCEIENSNISIINETEKSFQNGSVEIEKSHLNTTTSPQNELSTTDDDSQSSSIFLNPTNNLRFLLNMTTSQPSSMESQLDTQENKIKPVSPIQETRKGGTSILKNQSKINNNDFESLEEFYSDTKVLKSNPLFNDHVSDNIQSVSTYLGNVFSDDLMKGSNSWPILDQLGEQMSPDNHNIISHTHGISDNKLQTPVLDSLNHHQQFPVMLDNDDEFQLEEIEEYTDDLAKLEALHPKATGNFSPIPLLYQQRVIPKSSLQINEINDLEKEELEEELEEELDEEQMRFHTPKSLDLISTSSEIPYSANSSNISPAQFWNSIPNGLLPLPDILLNVPEYFESFMFFLNSTSEILIPADSSIYTNNPFKVVLPKLAMTNDGLMSLCISFGLSHQNLLTNQNNDPTGVLDQLLSRALSELLLLLQDKSTATSDLTLTLVLFMSTLIVFTQQSDKWKIHLKGAKQILLMRGYKKPFSKLISDFKSNKETGHDPINFEIKQSRLIYFLVRWYAYDDIFTKLSSPLQPSEDEISHYLEKLQKSTRTSSDISSTSTTPWSLLGNNDAVHSVSPSKSISVGTTTTTSGTTTNHTYSKENSLKIEELSNNNEFDLDKVHQLEYDIDEYNNPKAIVHDESHEDIDYFLGFNIKFLPLFSQLYKLIKYANILKKIQKLKYNGDSSVNFNDIAQLTPKLVTRAIEMQSDFQKLNSNSFVKPGDLDNSSIINDNSLNSNNSINETKSLNSIVATNQCFLYMGLIQLYRRVLQVPKNSKLIQEMSNSIISLYKEYIGEEFPGQLCLLLPMFIGASECLDLVNRELFAAALVKFHSKGSPTALVGLDIVKMCWEKDMDWWDVVIAENIDIPLL